MKITNIKIKIYFQIFFLSCLQPTTKMIPIDNQDRFCQFTYINIDIEVFENTNRSLDTYL